MHGITITRDNATKVIALAKTLQDKIALVDNKIDKVNVANNLTTTEADFVLDARQGKALQDQLTSLNGSLNLIACDYPIYNIVGSTFLNFAKEHSKKTISIGAFYFSQQKPEDIPPTGDEFFILLLSDGRGRQKIIALGYNGENVNNKYTRDINQGVYITDWVSI